jgi:hypothetical protein
MKAYTKKPGSEDRFLHAAGVDCFRDESDRTIVVAELGWRPADAPSRLQDTMHPLVLPVLLLLTNAN